MTSIESGVHDICNTGGNNKLFQVLTVFEGIAADVRHTVRDDETFKLGAAPECVIADLCQSFRQGDFGQVLAAFEGVRDFCNAVRDDDFLQAFVVFKSICFDFPDAIRNLQCALRNVQIIDKLLGCFLDQHVVLHFEVRVFRGNLDGFEAGAPTEGAVSQFFQPGRQGDGLQLAVAIELLEAHGDHAVRERNGFQAADAAERKVADGGYAVRDFNGLQALSFKRTGSDFFDAPEHFIVPAFSGVLEQGHGAFFDQHIIVENIYGMVGGDLNGGQLGAVGESTFRDVGHAVRDGDGFQAGAAAKSEEIN